MPFCPSFPPPAAPRLFRRLRAARGDARPGHGPVSAEDPERRALARFRSPRGRDDRHLRPYCRRGRRPFRADRRVLAPLRRAEIIGAFYLLWLAYGALRHGAALRLQPRDGPSASLAKTYLTGVLINITNPKIILFFVTFLPQFIDAGDASATPKFFFLGAAFVVIGSLVNGLLILIASSFVAAARANPRAIRLFDFGVAGLMGAFAARLLIAEGR